MSHFLPHNELPATLRLVNRTLAQQLKQPQHTTIRLSHACPLHAFQRHWAAPGATRGLRLHDRRRLLRLTARSGVVENLDVAIAAADCCLATEVLAAAAGANRLAVAEHLRGDRYGMPLAGEVLVAAAGAGRAPMVEWCLAQGCASDKAAAAAAKHGHRAVLERLLGRTSAEGGSTASPASLAAAGAAVGAVARVDVAALLEGAARGMPLEVLQQLHEEHSVRLPGRRVAGGGADGGGGGAEGPDGDGGGGGGVGGGADGGAVRLPILTRREQVKVMEAAAASPAVLAASATLPSAAAVAEAAAGGGTASAPEEEPEEGVVGGAGCGPTAGATVAVAGAPPTAAWTASATAAAGSGLPLAAAPPDDGGEAQFDAAVGETAGVDGVGTGEGTAALEAEPAAEDADETASGLDSDPAAASAPAVAPAKPAALPPAPAEPAWRTKLRWLESLEYPKPAEAWSAVAAMSPPSCGCGSSTGSTTGCNNSNGAGSSCRHLRAGCCVARVSCQGTCAAATGGAAASSSTSSSGGSSSGGSSAAAQGADWRERFQYLRSAGYPLNVGEALRRAANAGHEAALQYLLATREGRRLVLCMRRAQPDRTEGGSEVAGAPGADAGEAGMQAGDVGQPGEGPRLELGPGPGEQEDDEEGPGGEAVSGADALHAVSRAARAAARGGHVGVLRILAAHGLNLKQVPLLLSAAVRKRQLECAAWLLEQVFGLPPQSLSVTNNGTSSNMAVSSSVTGDPKSSAGKAAVVVGGTAAAASGGDRVAAVAACGEIVSAEPDAPPPLGATEAGAGATAASPAPVPPPPYRVPAGLLTRTLLLSAAGSGCPKMVAFVHERLRVGGTNSSNSGNSNSNSNSSSDSLDVCGSASNAVSAPGCSGSPPADAGVVGPSEYPADQAREERRVAPAEQRRASAACDAGARVTEMSSATSAPAAQGADHAPVTANAPSLEAPPPPLASASVDARQDAVPAGVPEAVAAAAASAEAAEMASAGNVAASPEEDEEDGSQKPQPAWDEVAWTAAAKAGCVEVLEQLASWGCVMGTNGDAYVTAARNGDLATLRCLHRLGCPWGPNRPPVPQEDSDDSFAFLAGPSTVFARAVTATARREWSGLPVLQLLLDLGCPVDWDEAASRARDFRHSKPETWLWVAAQQAKAEEGEGGAARGERRQGRGRGRARRRADAGAGGAAGGGGAGWKRCVALAVLGCCAFAARSLWFRRAAGRRLGG
ncbi:hypothetical protein HYH02_005011 [Chlamydomonas schloesseri]|uniref:Uncharacterized protein n=1 Tax=Chlamydomonas schloesseri TaxID=2026947 RepID=A0A835WPT8_9CHLO|nr:hypothetical protein HYH02_005011 [Chlamydomonas schloesseri]|eukprot:KAG2450510.1 hypothetical protein HYH02_005011 [Chlamydomonas schloesseri]